MAGLCANWRDICGGGGQGSAGALDEAGGRRGEIGGGAGSVGPGGETRGSVRGFLARHRLTGRMQYIIGSAADLQPLWRAWYVAAQRGDARDSVHSARVVLVDREGRQAGPYAAGLPLDVPDLAPDIRPLTRDQASAVLAAAQEAFPEDYPLLLCAFRTGMRMGELLGLAWADVDFEANAIEVRRSYSHGHFDTPKSHKGRRVDMSDQLASALQGHREALLARCGGRLPTTTVPGRRKAETAIQLVFPSQTGGPRDGDNLRRRVFYRLLEIADVPRVRFHATRHTFAGHLLQQGESLHYVKVQLGHASIQTTVDVYGHLVPGSNRNAVNRLDDAAAPALKLVQGSAG